MAEINQRNQPTMKMSQEAQRLRALDIRMGRLKKEWLEDPEVRSFINAMYELIAKA